MELLLIDVAQVYMNLLWFENLLLIRLWVWNTYLVLLWNRALAYPRALLHSGGPLSRKFWQLTIPLNMSKLRYFVRLLSYKYKTSNQRWCIDLTKVSTENWTYRVARIGFCIKWDAVNFKIMILRFEIIIWILISLFWTAKLQKTIYFVKILIVLSA